MKKLKKNGTSSIIVVAILGGLGSQMFKYAFYLNIKKNIKNSEYYIDTTPFYIMKMWNGYELEKIFNIKVPDIISFYSDEEKKNLSNYKFGYANYAIDKINKLQISTDLIYRFNRGKLNRWFDLTKKRNFIVRILYEINNKILNFSKSEKDYIDSYPENYMKLNKSIYFDEFNHTSDYYIRDVREQLITAFAFPQFLDRQNISIMKKMQDTNSIAIHIRRSDHLYDNEELIDNGYFSRAINFIKKNVDNPIFFIFSEEITWCQENKGLIGLIGCELCYIDWNKGEYSYRDMQLMTYCKHNILAISAFSWWGYYLSLYENKIVCAPKGWWFEVKNHF